MSTYSFINNHLWTRLQTLKQTAKSTGDITLSDRCETIIQEYRYMLEFIASGGKDENKEQFVSSLNRRINSLEEDIYRRNTFSQIPGHEAVFAQINGMDTSASALIEALRDNTLSPMEHYEVLSRAFSAILFSYAWTQREQKMWTAYLIASDTNEIDAQTLIPAIMLSCQISFCVEKFRTMVYVYLTSDSEPRRQRALVGWCVCLHSGGDDNLADELLESEETQREVLKLLMQMVSSIDASKDGEKIQREIMPELLKHQMKSGILSDDLIKGQDETLADILNPGREEQEMEEVEKSIGKMTEMMKNGSDIFFGEFSKMKRYPFFYKPVNWFMPFTYDHPHLADARKKLDEVKSLHHIYRNGPFCDSDKYSFTFGLSSVISSLPDKIREMLSTGEVGPLGTLPQGSEREITPDYLRRMYLQDLYRFFNLSPQLKLSTIFDKIIICMPFLYTQMNGMFFDFGKFLIRNGHYDIAKTLLFEFDMDEVEEVKLEYHILCAMYHRSLGNSESAFKHYQQAYEIDPQNMSVLRGYARYALIMGDVELAKTLYGTLYDLQPDSLPIALNRVLANVNGGNAPEMLNEIYRLDLENENNASIKRLLAWTLMCCHREKQAEGIFSDLLSGVYGEPTLGDRLSMVELYWVSGRASAAIDAMKQLLDKAENAPDINDCVTNLDKDFDNLKSYFPVGSLDTMLLIDAVRML